jgi:hypothetical protein
MKGSKMLEILELVNGVTSNTWKMVQSLVEQINKGAIVVDAEWCDKHKRENPQYYK